jgi:DNA-binding transcriptional ArsR family regulator
MEDIRSVLTQFKTKTKNDGREVQKASVGPLKEASSSEIPDVFFDVVIQKFRLNRLDIAVLMYLYRQVWCRPNLYKSHGIGPLNSYAEMSTFLGVSHEELAQHIRALENFGLVETVRSGQYFVRKYFTPELDADFNQNYDEFF